MGEQFGGEDYLQCEFYVGVLGRARIAVKIRATLKKTSFKYSILSYMLQNLRLPGVSLSRVAACGSIVRNDVHKTRGEAESIFGAIIQSRLVHNLQ